MARGHYNDTLRRDEKKISIGGAAFHEKGNQLFK